MGRRDAAKLAEEMIESELNEFVRWQRSLNAVNSIRHYRQHMIEQSDAELQQALQAGRRGEDAEEDDENGVERSLPKRGHADGPVPVGPGSLSPSTGSR